MATVIRAARIDPERVVLNPRPAIAALRRDADAGVSRNAPPAPSAPATPAMPVLAAPSGSPKVDATAEWASPVEQGASLSPVTQPPPLDRDAERKAFMQELERERESTLTAARDEGLKQGNAEWEERIAALEKLLASAHEVLAADIAGTEDVIVEIAFTAACRIVGETVAKREGALAVVREVTRAIREREKLVVRVSPDDFAMLDEHRSELLSGDDGAQLELVADERVALGGCLVETTGGTVDARLETQFQRLAETLADARRMQGEVLA